MTFGSVSATAFSDAPVYLIGGGPSARGLDFERLRGRGHVVAINDMYPLCPATVFFTECRQYLMRRTREIAAMTMPVYTPRDLDIIPPNVVRLRQCRDSGLSEDRSTVTLGGVSGYGALNLVYHGHPPTVYLFGYDLVQPPKGTPTHAHAGYAWHSRANTARYYPAWAEGFATTVAQLRARGVRVVNCNPHSAIKCFEFADPREVLEAA